MTIYWDSISFFEIPFSFFLFFRFPIKIYYLNYNLKTWSISILDCHKMGTTSQILCSFCEHIFGLCSMTVSLFKMDHSNIKVKTPSIPLTLSFPSIDRSCMKKYQTHLKVHMILETILLSSIGFLEYSILFKHLDLSSSL